MGCSTNHAFHKHDISVLQSYAYVQDLGPVVILGRGGAGSCQHECADAVGIRTKIPEDVSSAFLNAYAVKDSLNSWPFVHPVCAFQYKNLQSRSRSRF